MVKQIVLNPKRDIKKITKKEEKKPKKEKIKLTKEEMIQEKKEYLTPIKKDTELKMVDPSDIKIDNITLIQQKPNDIEKYTIVFKQLNNFREKKYYTRLVFCSEGKNYGDTIILTINVLNGDEYNKKKLDEFRKTFYLTEKDYPDEELLTSLKDNNFDFESTMTSLFN